MSCLWSYVISLILFVVVALSDHHDVIELREGSKEGYMAGADPGFHLGGGRKRLCANHAHYERGTELTFGRGPGPA